MCALGKGYVGQNLWDGSGLRWATTRAMGAGPPLRVGHALMQPSELGVAMATETSGGNTWQSGLAG